MKFLYLAYGDEKDWNALSPDDRNALLAQDQAIRDRGALMGAVRPDVLTVRAWDGLPRTSPEPFACGPAPLAGFSIIEADSLDEVVQLVAGTPCARAKGSIEIRPILTMNDETGDRSQSSVQIQI
jgi:hypothetical protein